MKILFAGPNGSGKTTQAKILAQKLRLYFASAGDILREKAQEDSEEGNEVKRFLGAGVLGDDEMTAKYLKEKLAGPEAEKGFVLDGFPRRVSQLEHFDPGFDVAFFLDIPDEEAKKRLLARGRADDTPEVIEERLRIYHQETEPVVDYYQKLGKLIRIDGTKDIESVAEEIKQKLASFQAKSSQKVGATLGV
ncbi:MAG: nucleoside monophosphate kinase [Candidatus Daviesbacteria bacterium]